METVTPGFFKRLFANPLAVRELRVACRSWKLVVILTSYLLVQGAIFAIWVYVKSPGGIYENPTSIGSGLFTTLSVVLVVIVMLVFPAFSSTAIAAEHERKSFDLLLLTPLSPWEIALGKFFAAGIQAGVFLVATVPLFAVANLFGGIEPAAFFVVIWMLVLLSLLIGFLGVYASSLVTRSIPAVLVTYVFAMFFGFILLVVFLLLTFQPFLVAALPIASFLADPTLQEALFYIGALTLTCAIWCTFLFLSTTNRLKPTSHNKSTGLRIFWTLVAIVAPLQVAAFFLLARLPEHGTAFGTLVLGAIYVALLLLVPAMTAPAEAPLPSRRVRREMDRIPRALSAGGASMFFPGSARGALHSSLLVLLGMLLMCGAMWVAFMQLDARLDEPAALSAEFLRLSPPVPQLSAPVEGPTLSLAQRAAQMRADVMQVYSHQQTGFVLLLVTLGLTLLLVVQTAWRLSLSGLSKSLSSVMAALLLAVWIIVPFVAQSIGPAGAEEDRVVAQFSPVQAAVNALSVGGERGRASLLSRNEAEPSQRRAAAFNTRWWTFAGATAAMILGLMAINLASHRRVMRLVQQATKAAEARHEQSPTGVSAQELERALEVVRPPGEPPAQA